MLLYLENRLLDCQQLFPFVEGLLWDRLTCIQAMWCAFRSGLALEQTRPSSMR
jgi:hypothetical protein